MDQLGALFALYGRVDGETPLHIAPVAWTIGGPCYEIVPEKTVPASARNRASRANSSHVARSRKLLKRDDLRGKTAMAELLIGG
jgi:hypothetical protein